MQTTKIFKSGNSMAIRLPKGFSLEGEEVEIEKVGNEIRIREIPKNLGDAFKLLVSLPDDFFSEDRIDTPPQDRESF